MTLHAMKTETARATLVRLLGRVIDNLVSPMPAKALPTQGF